MEEAPRASDEWMCSWCAVRPFKLGRPLTALSFAQHAALIPAYTGEVRAFIYGL